MNKLRKLFDKDYDASESLRKIEEQFKNDKCCCTCKNSIQTPHYEMSYYAGSDDYCKVHEKHVFEYGYGQQCLFYEYQDKE